MKAITYIILIFLPILVNAQNYPAPLTPFEKTQVIDSISKRLRELYVYPELAEQMSRQLKKNDYTRIKDPNTFAEQLTKDLRDVCHDKHLGVRYDPHWVPEGGIDSIADARFYRSQNFGFKEVKVLEGNIGYLNLNVFADPAIGGATAASAMNFLSNTDALIIDLRNNGGGSTEMVQLLASYLFGGQPQPLTDIYWRPTNNLTQYKTLPYVQGKRMPDIDVYVLTSKNTFSAAEDFSYSLQNLKRITLIGETTGGGAHPVGPVSLTDRFMIHIPQGRSISTITKTDWEGTGVKPDIEIAAKDALLAAQVKALEKLSAKDPANYQVGWALTALKAKLQPLNINITTLSAFAGIYGERRITLENGKLYFQKSGDTKHLLIPLADDLFMIEDLPYVRIKMIRENGKITGLSRVYDDGRSVNDPRTGDL